MNQASWAMLFWGLILLGSCGGEQSSESEVAAEENTAASPAPLASSLPPETAATSLTGEGDDIAATPTEATALDGPPPPPSSAYIALLTPEQTTEIRAADIPLVVPTAIPAGFVVEQVTVKQDERFAEYQILYRDNRDRCFVVEYGSGGFGGPATEYRVPINPPLVNDGEKYGLNYGSYNYADSSDQLTESELHSDWLVLEEIGGYRLAGAAYINNRLTPDLPCQDVTVEEAVELVESFALITEEIVGDG
ncbi:MAG: hypothetical protein AAGH78_09280 [Cyanobacteria bacterium P01_H01_bin.58]